MPITLKAGFGVAIAEDRQTCAAFQNPVSALLKPQGIDDLLQAGLEIDRVQRCALILPRGEKAIADAVHICAQMPNQTGLRRDLRALRIGIFLFLGPYGPDQHFHRYSSK